MSSGGKLPAHGARWPRQSDGKVLASSKRLQGTCSLTTRAPWQSAALLLEVRQRLLGPVIQVLANLEGYDGLCGNVNDFVSAGVSRPSGRLEPCVKDPEIAEFHPVALGNFVGYFIKECLDDLLGQHLGATRLLGHSLIQLAFGHCLVGHQSPPLSQNQHKPKYSARLRFSLRSGAHSKSMLANCQADSLWKFGHCRKSGSGGSTQRACSEKGSKTAQRFPFAGRHSVHNEPARALFKGN